MGLHRKWLPDVEGAFWMKAGFSRTLCVRTARLATSACALLYTLPAVSQPAPPFAILDCEVMGTQPIEKFRTVFQAVRGTTTLAIKPVEGAAYPFKGAESFSRSTMGTVTDSKGAPKGDIRGENEAYEFRATFDSVPGGVRNFTLMIAEHGSEDMTVGFCNFVGYVAPNSGAEF